MATPPKPGGRNWNGEVAVARSHLRNQRRLIREYLDQRIEADLLLTRLISENNCADEKLEDILRTFR